MPELGGKPGSAPKQTLEIRGMEHWLWNKMTVEPRLLHAYLAYLNSISDIALDMAHEKIANPDISLADTLQSESPIATRIANAVRGLQHDVSLAAFKAAISDCRIGSRDDGRYALRVLNNCFRYNPKSIIGRRGDANPYPLLELVAPRDLAQLVDEIGAIPIVRQRLGRLDAKLKSALTATLDQALEGDAITGASVRQNLQAWRTALNGTE